MAKILAFAGSGRQDSLNRKLVNLAADAAREAGASVTVVNLRDLQLPIYDGDLEAEKGIPEAAKAFKKQMIEHDGLLISSPEYNSSISPLLKNAIDWASRPEEGEPPLVAFNGKVAGLLAASPGGLGGLRGLVHLRAILQNINVMVVPQQLAVAKADKAFDDEGQLIENWQRDLVNSIAQRVVEVADALK